MKRIHCALMGLVLLGGCSGHGGHGHDKATAWQADKDRPTRKVKLEASTFTDKCTETWGDSCDECQAEEMARIEDCWDTCYEITINDGSAACAYTCEDIGSVSFCDSECSEEPESCLERGYTFAPSLERDDTVLEACKAAVKRDEDCDEQHVGSDCDLCSRVERAEAVEVYRCVSAAQCGTDVDACFASLPQRGLAEQVQALCPEEELEPDMVPALEGEGNWVRDDVARDIEECANYCGYGGFDACVQAWIRGTTGWSFE